MPHYSHILTPFLSYFSIEIVLYTTLELFWLLSTFAFAFWTDEKSQRWDSFSITYPRSTSALFPSPLSSFPPSMTITNSALSITSGLLSSIALFPDSSHAKMHSVWRSYLFVTSLPTTSLASTFWPFMLRQELLLFLLTLLLSVLRQWWQHQPCLLLEEVQPHFYSYHFFISSSIH